jgi:hypothetical protein
VIWRIDRWPTAVGPAGTGQCTELVFIITAMPQPVRPTRADRGRIGSPIRRAGRATTATSICWPMLDDRYGLAP